MANDDLTIQVLIEIRDQIGHTNARLDRVHEDLGTLASRMTESELRTATVMHEMVASNREIGAVLRTRLDLRDRVERCEQEILALQRKVG